MSTAPTVYTQTLCFCILFDFEQDFDMDIARSYLKVRNGKHGIVEDHRNPVVEERLPEHQEVKV